MTEREKILKDLLQQWGNIETVQVPHDIIEFGQRVGLENWASAVYLAGIVDARRYVQHYLENNKNV